MKKLITTLTLPMAVHACGKDSTKESGNIAIQNSGSVTTPYVPVEGDEATQHFALTANAAPMDQTALAALLSREIDGNPSDAALAAGTYGVAIVSAAELALLRRSEPERAKFDATVIATDPIDGLVPAPSEYEDDAATEGGLNLWDEANIPPLKEPKDFNYSKDKVDLTPKKWQSKSEFLISGLGKIPVRDQGQRGTCAAHAMAGFLEYKLLKQYPKTIKTIDLSEERMYMMAKSDLWNKGGGRPGNDGGSSLTGATWLSWGWDGYTVKSEPKTYHIPLEVDCPYDASKGTNELHLPQRLSCQRGVVSTKRHTVSYLLQKSGEPFKLRSNALRSAQEIFDFLFKYDLPVPVASNITEQWFSSSGVITLKAEPAKPAAFGHAYLIVGARKLDEAKYPGEGGMCWVIKNSWGAGWGQQGLACVTLAWFNRFHQGHEFGLPLELNVDLDYIRTRGKKVVGNPTTGAPAATNIAREANPPVKVAINKPAENIFGSSLRLTEDQSSEVPDFALPDPETQVLEDPNEAEPPEAAVITADGYTAVDFVTPSGTTTLGLYRVDGAEIRIRGVYRDDAGTTTDLTLGFDGGSLITLPVDQRAPVPVGSLRDGRISLCVDEFRPVCHFNFVRSDGRLVVGLTKQEYERESADPDAPYQPLVAYSGYSIESAPAGADKIDVRLLLEGIPTAGVRFRFDSSTGGVFYGGKEVGSVAKTALCSGEYAGICRFVVNEVDRGLHVFFMPGKGL